MLSLNEIYERVAAGLTKDEAGRILAGQVEELKGLGIEEAEAFRRVRENIGYFGGYYDREIQDKAYDLFDTEHPIFGRTHPTPEEALAIGMAMGEKAKRERSHDTKALD